MGPIDRSLSQYGGNHNTLYHNWVPSKLISAVSVWISEKCYNVSRKSPNNLNVPHPVFHNRQESQDHINKPLCTNAQHLMADREHPKFQWTFQTCSQISPGFSLVCICPPLFICLCGGDSSKGKEYILVQACGRPWFDALSTRSTPEALSWV